MIVGDVEAAALYGGHSDLSKTMSRYAERVCEYCQSTFGESERPRRDEQCTAVMQAAIERVRAAHNAKPIDNLPAYLNGELKRMSHIGDLCGDDLVAELRHPKPPEAAKPSRNGRKKSEPTHIEAILAGVVPTEQAQGGAEKCGGEA